jgi:Flp pilus assembly protein TadG
MRYGGMEGSTPAPNSRGTTALEFALILPVFAFLICGIVDMGYYLFVQHTLQFATAEGARLAMVGGTLNGANGEPLSTAASIVQEIENEAALGNIPASALQISIFPITSTYGDPAGWTGEQDAGDPGDYMRVVTTYVYTFFTPFMGQFFPNGVSTITAQTTYRNELF